MFQEKAQERRAHRRAGPFDGAWNGASGGCGVRIADLSEGGCFVDSMVAPPPGEAVVVTLAVPQGGEIRVDGHVTTADPGIGFGVQFSEFKKDQRKEIRRAVEQVLVGDGVPTVTAKSWTQDDKAPIRELGFAV